MPAKKKQPTFEEQLASLQNIVKDLQQGELSLDESIKQFSDGMEIAKNLKQQLNQAEETLAKLVDENGELQPAEDAGDDLSNNGVQNQGYQSQFTSKDQETDDNPF